MRTYIGHHQVISAAEFREMALGFDEPAGIDRDLFRGPLAAESPQERAARLDVAREVLEELRAAGAAGDEVAELDALYAEALTRTVPLRRSGRGTGRSSGRGEAA
ncbi:hypothetical protein [Streptomyces syringium]|uniref:hypothetical protein n=1 Tax=Streptomyces syringium TaxID=76729 RepID=UPI003434C96A